MEIGDFFQKPQKSTPFLSIPTTREIIDKAMLELQMKTQALDAVTHFGDAAWSVNQDEGTIVFRTKTGMVVTAPVQIIGSYNCVLTHLDPPEYRESRPPSHPAVSCSAKSG